MDPSSLLLFPHEQLIELNSNPDAGERRVRATLKPLKTSRRDSDEMEIQQKIKVLTDENCRSRQRLKEVRSAFHSLQGISTLLVFPDLKSWHQKISTWNTKNNTQDISIQISYQI